MNHVVVIVVVLDRGSAGLLALSFGHLDDFLLRSIQISFMLDSREIFRKNFQKDLLSRVLIMILLHNA